MKYVIPRARYFLLFFLTLNIAVATGQNLSFTKPVNFLPGVKTDKAIDITNFKDAYFVTWKDAGKTATVNVCYLGKKYDITSTQHQISIPDAQTAFAPVLRVTDKYIYLFWIGVDGSLKYLINNSDTGFDVSNIHTAALKNNTTLSMGITAAATGDKIIIASHADNKGGLLYILLQAGGDGLFGESEALPVGREKSADYPFVVSLNNGEARFCYRGFKDPTIYYSDYTIATNSWQKAMPLNQSKSGVAPAIYHIWNGERLFYIWKGAKKDARLYYATANSNDKPAGETVLPDYFSTDNPVSICKIDDNNFILAYTGPDQQLYFSSFSNYNPTTWMQDVLATAKSNKTLQEIVLPGAHDAGMSILNGVGGQQSGTINKCNTLTQSQNISDQLNAGIRMFDLRAGTYNKELYAKHCASDCMADAIGGGYGEKLRFITTGIRKFLLKNKQEIVILTFSHFCETETPMAALIDSLTKSIGGELMYAATGKTLQTIPLRELAGKVIVTFEKEVTGSRLISSCAIAASSGAFMNFRREYAATNDIKKLLAKEEAFFTDLKSGVAKNDLIRLDWQITQSSDEAPMICNDFEDEKLSPIVNGAMLLANVIRKHESILDHSVTGNKYLPGKLYEWINSHVINEANKPNILYVDAAGPWITDICVDLNQSSLYKK